MILSAMAAAAMLLAETTPAAAPAPVQAAGATVSPATVTAAPKAGTIEADKTICKTEPILGSRMTRKVCYSASEHAQEIQEERHNLERIQQQGHNH